jgi:thiol-disulfide isomerase/thioredoxin
MPPINRRHFAASLAAAPLLATGLATGLGACRGDAAHVMMGMQVPRVRGTTTDGLGVDFAGLGKAALVRFWGLWCGPCTQDEPWWGETVRALRGRADLTILSVHVGEPPDSGPSLAEWVADQKPDVRVPVVDDATMAIMQAFKVPGTPTHILINAAGRIEEHAWAFKSARGVRSFTAKVNYILDRAAELAAASPASAR